MTRCTSQFAEILRTMIYHNISRTNKQQHDVRPWRRIMTFVYYDVLLHDTVCGPSVAQ